MYPGLQTVFAQPQQPLEQPLVAPMPQPQQLAPLGVGDAPAHPAATSPGTNTYLKGLQDYFKKQAAQQTEAAKNFDTGYHPMQFAQANLK